MAHALRFLAPLLAAAWLCACSSGPEPPEDGIPQGDYGFLRERVSWLIEQQLEQGPRG